MKKMLLLIMLVISVSCTKILIDEEEISKIPVLIRLNDDYNNETAVYHILFENINNDKKSFGINLPKENTELQTKVFPGNYNIYVYGLAVKTAASKKVLSYSINKNFEIIPDNKNFEVKLVKLLPDIRLEFDPDLIEYDISVNMTGIFEIFSLSSLSIKQGTDRYRSVKFIYDPDSSSYTAKMQLIQNGIFYANIGYMLKSKIDEKALELDNIYISTSLFSDIYLGEF
jgi:hypothetical protein